MFDFTFLLTLCFCWLLVLALVVSWLYQSNTKLKEDVHSLDNKISCLEKEVKCFPVVTTKLVNDKLQPIEQVITDVRGFTQTIDINIRLLIDKIDLAVKHNEQQ